MANNEIEEYPYETVKISPLNIYECFNSNKKNKRTSQ